VRAEFVHQVQGDAERAAVHADVFAHDEYRVVAAHFLCQRFPDGLSVSQFAHALAVAHGARPLHAYTPSASCAGSGSGCPSAKAMASSISRSTSALTASKSAAAMTPCASSHRSNRSM